MVFTKLLETDTNNTKTINNNKNNDNQQQQQQQLYYAQRQADCWLLLAQSEHRCFHFVPAYAALLRCFRARFRILGGTHSLSVATARLLDEFRITAGGSRLVSGIELKERIAVLNWVAQPQLSIAHVVGLFVQRLDDEHVLERDQLESLVAAAIAYQSTLIATTATTTKGSTMSATDIVDTLLVTTAPQLPQSSTASLAAAEEPVERQRIVVAASPTRPAKLMSPSKGSSATFSSSERTLNGGGKWTNPAVASLIRGTSHTTTLTTATATATVNSDMGDGESEDEEDKGDEMAEEEEVAAVSMANEPSPNSSTMTMTVATTPIAVTTTSIATNSADSDESPSKPRRQWRPISIHSPLRIAASGGLSVLSNIDMHGQAFRLLRTEHNGILFVRKTTPEYLRRTFRSRVLAIALLAWYASGQNNSLLVAAKSSAAKSVRFVEGNGQNPTATISATSATTVAAGNDEPDPKQALNALFGKRMGAPPKPPPSIAATATVTAAAKVCRELPQPPPLPSCWPPVPYTGEAAKPVASVTSGGTGVTGDPGATPTLAEPEATGPPKPKMKQIFLTSLPTIEGTFWSEPQEILISVGFDLVFCYFFCSITPCFCYCHCCGD
jgi:hypothetical protein